MAANATFALKPGVWFLRVRFVIFAPDSRREPSPPSGRKSTHPTVQILEASSVCRLKVTSIDGERKLIHVECGKGGKDRYAMLSPPLLDILRAYWRRARPGLWLFPGREAGDHVSIAALQEACRVARRTMKLSRPVTAHSLRHSFATHLLESGVELRIIQVLLGHSDLSSTTRYAQVATHLIANTPSPFDRLSLVVIPPE